MDSSTNPMLLPSEQIKQSVREFLNAHFNLNDWYLGAHVNRISETLARSAAYIRPGDRLLEIGSYGQIPLLVWHLFGLQPVLAYSLQAGYMGYRHGKIQTEEDPQAEFQCHIQAVNIEKDVWPQADNSLDVILCFEVLEHLREHPVFMFNEANRVLKPGGYIIITTPNSSSYHAIINILYHESPFLYSVYGKQREGMAHIKEYAINELQNLVKNSGFEIVNHSTFSPYQDEKDDLFPELREVLNQYGLKNELSGSTQFLVARKTTSPRFEYYQPLYDVTRVWSLPAPPLALTPETGTGVEDKNEIAVEVINTSIIVPINGDFQDLSACMEACANEYPIIQDVEMVLVPYRLNASQTAQLKTLCQTGTNNIRLVSSQPDLSFAETINHAVQTSQAGKLLFWNCPKPGRLTELLNSHDPHHKSGILCSKTLLAPENNSRVERIHDCGIVFDAQKRPKYLYQYCLAEQAFTNHQRELQATNSPLIRINRDLFNKMGGLKALPSWSMMAFDLSLRVHQAGFTINLVPSCEAFAPPEAQKGSDDLILINASILSTQSQDVIPDEMEHYRRDGLALGPQTGKHIALVTPLAPLRTGVADYVQELLPALTQYMTLDLFVDGYTPDDITILNKHRIHFISDLEVCNLKEKYDQIIYHIGNNHFHTAIYEAAAQTGGIMVIHEYDSKGCIPAPVTPLPSNIDEMRSDFDELIYLANNPDIAAAVHRGEFSSGWDHFARHGHKEERIYSHGKKEAISNKKLWQRLFKRADGIIVHNRHSRDILQAEFPNLPVAVIPHLLSPKVFSDFNDDTLLARRKLNLPEDALIILSMGLIQPHKRNHITVQSFASFIKRHPNSFLVLAGESLDQEYDIYLKHLIKSSGLQERVFILGWVFEGAFFDWIAAGDIMVNLRYPSRGEESGTLIRSLGAGKPTIISDYAQYVEIPDDCVIKISFENEVQNLEKALERLSEDASLRQSLSENARAYFRSHNAVERVAGAYAEFCNNTPRKDLRQNYNYAPETQANILWDLSECSVNDPAPHLILAMDRLGLPIRVKIRGDFKNLLSLNQNDIQRFQQLQRMPLADNYLQFFSGALCDFKRDPQATYAIVMANHQELSNSARKHPQPDEYWVPSAYSRNCLIQQGLPAQKITVVPLGVSTLAYGTYIRQPRKEKPFTFLNITDWTKHSHWQDILLAFLQEFGDNNDFRLCFQTSAGALETVTPDDITGLFQQFAYKHPTIKENIYRQVNINSRLIELDDKPSLYAYADSYIHLHADAAFGRPLLEAMSIGLPVISINFGGQQDYINAGNAFIVTGQRGRSGRVTLNINSLRSQMRELVNNPSKAEACGINARHKTLTAYTWEHAAGHALKRLEAISGSLPGRPCIIKSQKAPQNEGCCKTENPPGFNVIGYISGNLGIGVTARNVVQSLSDKGLPFKILDLDPGLERYNHDLRFKSYTVSSPEELTHPINLFVLPPPDLSTLIKDQAYFRDAHERLNVAWSMWELPEVPNVWHADMQKMDVLIAESQFIRQTFNTSFPDRVNLLAVHPLYLPDGITAQRSRFGLPEDCCLLITSLAPHSDIQRKNPMAVIEAFQRAFAEHDNVHLVIKINNPITSNQMHPYVAELQERYAGNKQIHIITHKLSYLDVLSLYACCDVYVSLHRSEGLG
ncbi:MAG: glycosyltransferase, partial [Anaerolineae bacterium]|nr:glycosyltransferase [Anaerolineae bacterium]